MLLLAVLMDEGFYKKCLHDHFAVPKKSSRITEVIIGWVPLYNQEGGLSLS